MYIKHNIDSLVQIAFSQYVSSVDTAALDVLENTPRLIVSLVRKSDLVWC